MTDEPYIAEAAALIGDPARANMLSALMDGRAKTAAELAAIAGVGAATASAHLAKLTAGALVTVEKQGRRRYFRLAGPEVATAIEALSAVTSAGPRRIRRPGPRDAAMRRLRTCYDHLAGEIAVALSERLTRLGWLTEGAEAFEVAPAGVAPLTEFGLDLPALRGGRRAFARRCLDWSERRAHLGGALGAALLTRFSGLGWIVREEGGRTTALTPIGVEGLRGRFGLDPDALGVAPAGGQRRFCGRGPEGPSPL